MHFSKSFLGSKLAIALRHVSVETTLLLFFLYRTSLFLIYRLLDARFRNCELLERGCIVIREQKEVSVYSSVVATTNFCWAIQLPVENQTFSTWKVFKHTVPSVDLASYVCMAFAILYFSSGKILKSALLSQLVAEHVSELIVFHSCEAFT